MVDGYFLEVIKSPQLPDEENEIILNQVQLGLRIRSIFGWIQIQQIRILQTGSGSYCHLPRINSNI